MWIILSIHDNDFYLDMSLLGEFVVRILDFLSVKRIPVDVDYKELLKKNIARHDD